MSESDVKPGDAIFFNTGWSALWGKNNDKFNSGEPGIGLEIAKWVIDKDLCMTGGDTWAWTSCRSRQAGLRRHSELQTKHGVFDGLIADKKYQFVYVFVPLPITGATGSPGLADRNHLRDVKTNLNNARWRVNPPFFLGAAHAQPTSARWDSKVKSSILLQSGLGMDVN